MSAEETARMLEAEGSDLANLKNYTTFRWFVDFEEKIVGSVSLKNISHSMGYAEIGYGISQTYHRRGIGTAAVAQLVEKVFSETSLRKLLAYVHDANLASCKLLEKLGFVQEGFLREHYVINGQAENEVLYALLKKDWADM
jgi:ribosomal-protein-alanine N-acetyltransferase